VARDGLVEFFKVAFEQRALSVKAANDGRSPASHGASPSRSADRRK
jgi:hypothetical protein